MPHYLNKVTGEEYIFAAEIQEGLNFDIGGREIYVINAGGCYVDALTGELLCLIPAVGAATLPTITFSASTGLDPVLTGGTNVVWTGPSGQTSTGTTPSPALAEAGDWTINADDLTAITALDASDDTVTAVTSLGLLTGLTLLDLSDNAGLDADAIVDQLYATYGSRANITVDLSGTTPNISGASVAKITEMSNDTWTYNADALLMTVKTDNTGTSNNDQFTIPLDGASTYDFTVYYDGEETAHTSNSDLTLTFPNGAGTYGIAVMGTFPRILFSNGKDKLKLTKVESYGNLGWGASFSNAFEGCSNCTDFGGSTAIPSNVTNLTFTWRNCSSATSFPAVNGATGVTNLGGTWYGCSSATSFPAVSSLTSVTNFGGCWAFCSTCTTFPTMPAATSATSLAQTWYNCTNGTSFPAVNALTSVNTLDTTWFGCSSATSFPAVSALTSVTNLTNTWNGCSSATSFPAVNTLTGITVMLQTWQDCTSATSFPAVSALTSVTSLNYTWFGCTGASSFPDISALTSVTNFYQTWKGCTGCTTVPSLPSSSTALTDVRESFFGIGSGMSGTVEDLWNATDFPNISLYAGCFTGATGLANYASIPNDWKGL